MSKEVPYKYTYQLYQDLVDNGRDAATFYKNRMAAESEYAQDKTEHLLNKLAFEGRIKIEKDSKGDIEHIYIL